MLLISVVVLMCGNLCVCKNIVSRSNKNNLYKKYIRYLYVIHILLEKIMITVRIVSMLEYIKNIKTKQTMGNTFVKTVERT